MILLIFLAREKSPYSQGQPYDQEQAGKEEERCDPITIRHHNTQQPCRLLPHLQLRAHVRHAPDRTITSGV